MFIHLHKVLPYSRTKHTVELRRIEMHARKKLKLLNNCSTIFSKAPLCSTRTIWSKKSIHMLPYQFKCGKREFVSLLF